MLKKLIFLLATIGLVANISGCTSKSAQDETEIVENADVDKIDAESSALTDGTAAAPATDDASLQAALGETSAPVADAQLDAPTEAPPPVTDAPTTDVAATEPVTTSPDIAAAPTLDETSLNDIPPPTDPSVMALTDTPAVTETPVVADSQAATETAPLVETPVATETPSTSSYTSEAAPIVESAPVVKAGSALKKVAATAPYQHGNGWVNTVYVARPGEKLKQISQTIFGSDKTKELKSIAENSYLKSRSVKAGDKIYYVSPNRPEDSTKTILYYEDIGMMPETYTAKAGDRLKKVAKKLLGSEKSWVELWTSNPVDSKDKLAEGETLKYWKSASSIAPVSTTTLAQNAPADNHSANLVDSTQMPAPPPPDAMANPGAGQQMAQNAPPPPDMNSLPPPPPPDAPMPPPPDVNAAGGMADAPPPPPPDMNAAPPPPPDMAPPPPPDVAAAHPGGDHAGKKFNPGAGEEEASAVGGLDQDTMMSLGALAVLVVALAFVLISRNKKKRAAEQAMTEHNVGT